MSRVIASLLSALLLALPSVAADEEPEEVVDIRPSQLRSMGSGGRAPLVLDVRTIYEFDAGHIPGAVNIPHTELEERLQEVQAGADYGVVLYCMRGPRARVGENTLQELEIGPLYHLDGGFLAWKRAGYKVVKTEGANGDGAVQ